LMQSLCLYLHFECLTKPLGTSELQFLHTFTVVQQHILSWANPGEEKNTYMRVIAQESYWETSRLPHITLQDSDWRLSMLSKNSNKQNLHIQVQWFVINMYWKFCFRYWFPARQ
jgi:hypothetical protein